MRHFLGKSRGLSLAAYKGTRVGGATSNLR